jgi:hypothetical protein
MPISASVFTSSCVPTSPMPAGPATAPAAIMATIGETPSRASPRMNASASA